MGETRTAGIDPLAIRIFQPSLPGLPRTNASARTIEPEGLDHLLQVAEEHGADAVISPPWFVSDAGILLPRKTWVVHDYIQSIGLTHPVLVPRAHVSVWPVVHGAAGSMGSSARVGGVRRTLAGAIRRLDWIRRKKACGS